MAEAEEEQTIADITKTFEPLQSLIGPSGSNRSELWQAWHFLQVYANWGLRLPQTTTDFTAVLGASPAPFDFFRPMQEGNKLIRDACRNFLNQVFPKVIQVGLDLKSYAEDASSSDGEMFSDIVEMLKNRENEDALQFLSDLQEDAAAAAENANTAKENLTKFSTALVEAVGKLEIAQQSLEGDQQTNSARIAVLDGDEDQEGSMRYYRKQIEELRARHTEAAVAAGTSPLYFWVAPPIGLIATGVVMGVYTDKAIKAMQQIKDFEDSLRKDQAELSTALSAQNIYRDGSSALKNVVLYTTVATERCATVKAAWDAIGQHIAKLARNIEKTTQTTDGEEQVRKLSQTTRYLRKVEASWDALLPDLRELLSDPYVAIAPGQKSISEVISMMESK